MTNAEQEVISLVKSMPNARYKTVMDAIVDRMGWSYTIALMYSGYADSPRARNYARRMDA
jgi:hypothetical protein